MRFFFLSVYMLQVTFNFPIWLWETLVHKPLSKRIFVINNINIWWEVGRYELGRTQWRQYPPQKFVLGAWKYRCITTKITVYICETSQSPLDASMETIKIAWTMQFPTLIEQNISFFFSLLININHLPDIDEDKNNMADVTSN
jgi:hypothetical protein